MLGILICDFEIIQVKEFYEKNNLSYLILSFAPCKLVAEDYSVNFSICNGCSDYEMQQRAFNEGTTLTSGAPNKVHILNLENDSVKAYRVLNYREPGYTTSELIEVSPDSEIIEAMVEISNIEEVLKATADEHPELVRALEAVYDLSKFGRGVGVYRIPVAKAWNVKVASGEAITAAGSLPSWKIGKNKLSQLILVSSGMAVIGIADDGKVVLLRAVFATPYWEPFLLFDPETGELESASESATSGNAGGGGYSGNGSVSMATLTIMASSSSDSGSGFCISQKSHPTYCYSE